MDITLQRKSRVAALIAVCVAVSVYLALATAEITAAYLSQRPALATLQFAARLQPWNAEYQYLLGRYYLLVESRPDSAASYFNRAVGLDAYSARYWLDLAAAYNVLDGQQQRKRALEEGEAADPTNPRIAWEAANLYLSHGDNAQALRGFRTVLTSDYSLLLPVLQQCRRITDLDTILKQVMPPDPQAYSTLLDLLMVNNSTAESERVWTQLVQLNQPLRRSWVFDYVRYLLEQHEVEHASEVWQQAAKLANLSAYQRSRDNLVINGDFSLDVLNGGFDWLHDKSAGVTLALDPTQIHSGSHSLCITFPGKGVDDAGIRQLVPVEPNTEYDFSAYYKTGRLEGAGGPRFVIQDAYTDKPLLASAELTGADFWKYTGARFVTAADTRLIVIRIERIPAGSPIRGKLWIDGLRLAPRETDNVR